MSARRKYQLIEHTADVGIKVEAPTLCELFADAAYAMFDLLCDPEAVCSKTHQSVAVEADDYEELMVNWLTELLFLFDAQKLLLSEFDVTQIDGYRLRATVRGEEYDPGRHELGHDIKAVTYYGLQVRRENSKWTASVVFDI